MQQSKQIFYYQNSYRVTVYISHIAYHISEMLIFYADKVLMMAILEIHVFNFVILLESQKLDALDFTVFS